MKKTFTVFIFLTLSTLGFSVPAYAQFEPAPGSPAYQAAQAKVPAAQAAAQQAAAPANTANTTGFVPLAGIPNLTSGVTATQTGLQSFLRNLYFYLIGLAAIIAVFQIVRGGIMIAMNKDSISNQLSGKGHITQALLGLVLILAPALVFSIINPAILNLSVSLPPLTSTKWGTGAAPAPQNTTTYISQSGATSIGQQVQQAEQACTAKHMGIRLVPGPLVPSAVQCVQPLPAAGSSVTVAQCMQEPGYKAGYSLQQSSSITCQTSGVTSLMQQGGYVCSPLEGGGVCLHK